jgi:hypothetical protein
LFIGNGRASVANPDEVTRTGVFEGNLFVNVPGLPHELDSQEDATEFFKRIQLEGWINPAWRKEILTGHRYTP